MIIQAQLVRRGAQSRHVAEVLNTVVGESSFGLQSVSFAFSSPHVNFLMAELTARNQVQYKREIPDRQRDLPCARRLNGRGDRRARTFYTPAVED